MTASTFSRTVLGAVLAFTATTAAPLLAQDRQPLALASAKVSLAGTSNIHDYTASTTTVRVARLQLAGAPTGGDVWAAVITPGAVQAFEVVIPAATLHSTRAGLDKNMHKALKTKEHADIVFRLSRLEAKGAAVRAIGVLRVAGVEKEIGIDLTAVTKSGSLIISGSVDLLMTDFGIASPKAMMGMLRTDPKVTISFETVFSTPLT